MPTEYKVNPNPRGRQETTWYNHRLAIPIAIGAFVLIMAFVIFGAAGPDRTRTVDANRQPSAVTTPGPATGERVPAQTPVPSKSNTPGTQ